MKPRVDSEREDTLLLDLFRAIVSGRTDHVSELLVRFPGLANQPIRTGATRGSSTSYFFEEIVHYVYEGDTALHVAAAAYRLKVFDKLLANGAKPTFRNR